MPCYTVDQVLQINQLVNQVRTTLEQWAAPGSRFYELDAYSFLGSLLPCGRVPQAQDEIAVAKLRINDLFRILDILSNGTDDNNTGGTPDPMEDCKALVTAINALSAKLDITTTINNAFSAFIPTLILALDPKFTNITNAISQQTTTLNSSFSQVLIGINDTRVELREARERLIVIQSENKGVEILQRINDTRIELREARERLIRVEDCACNPADNGDLFDQDALIAALMVQINQALEANAILIFDSLYDQFVLLLGNLETRLSARIENPTWLAGVIAKLDLIIDLLKKLDEILAFLRALDVYIRGKLTEIGLDIDLLIRIANRIDAGVASLALAIQLMGSNINQLENAVSNVRSTVNNLTSISNNIYNEVLNFNGNDTNVDLSPVLTSLANITTLINNLNQELDKLQPPNLAGITTSLGCNISQTYSYGGSGFLGISSQIATISNQLNSLHSELCPVIANEQEIIQGELVSISCDDPDTLIRTQYSGRGVKALVAGLQSTSNNIVTLHRDICKQKEEEPNCFVLVPSDVDEELNIPRQLIIHWRVDNDQKLKDVSKWQSSIPIPIANLNWNTHFENLRWVRGNVTGRWYLQNSTARLGGYFNTRQNAIDTLNDLIKLTTLQPKTTEPRITTGGSTFITSTGVITKPFKAVVVEKQGNRMVPVKCYTKNNGSGI